MILEKTDSSKICKPRLKKRLEPRPSRNVAKASGTNDGTQTSFSGHKNFDNHDDDDDGDDNDDDGDDDNDDDDDDDDDVVEDYVEDYVDENENEDVIDAVVFDQALFSLEL